MLGGRQAISNSRELFGRYAVRKVLSGGSFGTVYLAEHINLKVLRAIKCIRKCRELCDMAYREADILKNLRHPAIPIIYDIEEDEECVYIVEEYVQGQSLKELISEKGQFHTNEATEIILKLCDVLKYLHSAGICHLDIKPDNIMMQNGNLRLLDYGSSWMEGTILKVKTGTVGYASPEMYGKGKISSASDIYSIGVLMLEMLTGMKSAEAVKGVHPPELGELIRKCICHSHTERIVSLSYLEKKLLKIKKRKSGSDVSFNIHVGGVERHCGTTFCSFRIAEGMLRKKSGVIICECNDSGDFLEIAKDSDFEFNGGIFNCRGINMFPEYNGHVVPPDFSGYNAVIRDFGIISEKNLNYFLSGDAVCIVSGCESYEIKRLYDFLERYGIPLNDRSGKFHVMITHSDAGRYKTVVRRHGMPNPVRVPCIIKSKSEKDWLPF